MTTGLRDTALNIVNRVRRKLGYSQVTDLTAAYSNALLEMMNEVLSECSDAGDWHEYYREAEVTAQTSVNEYEVAVSGLVKRIYEIHYGDQVAPLEVREVQDIRRLNKLSSFGEPRQFAVVGVNASSGNPVIRVHPTPTTAEASGAVFDIAYYQKPMALTTGATTPSLPSELVFKGLYAKALLEQNGGERSREYEVAYAEYKREKDETLNRFNSDTGTDVWFVPAVGRRH